MESWKLIGQFDVLQHFPRDVFASHAQLPTPIVTSRDHVRIYFATRDERQFSSIYFIDMQYSEESNEITWLDFSPQAILSPGNIGTFDEHGVYPSSVLKINDLYHLYYIGWNRGLTPPLFYSSVGLALSADGSSYSKISEGPILGRNMHEPYLVTSPFVEEENGLYKMHFVSGTKWVQVDGNLESRYDVKCIQSSSPTNWSSEARQTAIPLREGETNIARPWIVSNAEGNRLMYFSFLRYGLEGYQVGVAEQLSSGSWMRLDNELCFEGSAKSQSMAYPAVVEIAETKLMFLNGDNFGKSGFYVFKLESVARSLEATKLL